MDTFERVTRNTVEIVTEDELRTLLARPVKKVYAGYEPSGEIHLGHLVTVNKLVDLQDAGFEVTVLLADLHAFLNRKGTMEKVGELAEYNRRCFEGLGLKNVKYVLGSDLQRNREDAAARAPALPADHPCPGNTEHGRSGQADGSSDCFTDDISDHADGRYRYAGG